MTVGHPRSDQPAGKDVARYRANFLNEQVGVYLYSRCPTVFAQPLAIALVTAFNFAFHHIFTYRGKRKHL